MDQLTIGDPDCTFTMVISAMSNSHQFEALEDKWKEVASGLSLSNDNINTIENKLVNGGETSTDITFSILKTWRFYHPVEATLEKFVTVLRNCGLADLSQNIEEYFKDEHSPVSSQVQADSKSYGITDKDWDIRTFKLNDTSAVLVKTSSKENDNLNRNEIKGATFSPEMVDNEKAYELQGPLKHEARNGYALILNIIRSKSQGYREGAQYDSHILNQLLTQLGYEVTLFGDPCNFYTEKDILEIIEKFRVRVRYKNPKSIIVYIGCHGVNDRIVTSMDDDIKENLIDFKKKVVYQFDTNNCEELRDIPKIFLAQFCRQEYQQDGLSDQIENAVVCYATSKGNLAYRHPDDGSYFVKHLVQQISQRAHNTHFIQLLEKTRGALQNDTLEYMTKKVTQVCEYQSTFTKNLYFNV